MKQCKRDFHRHVRVVYRACRRIYGKEYVQDECLKVFKIVFPEYYRAKQVEEEFCKLSDTALERLAFLFDCWHPSDELKALLEKVLTNLSKIMERRAFVAFCEDIMPVVMRIRKLTDRECLRLMDVSEPDIDKMIGSGLSKSSLYKLACNSICISPMFHIFRKLFVETGPDIVKGEPMQLSLF